MNLWFKKNKKEKQTRIIGNLEKTIKEMFIIIMDLAEKRNLNFPTNMSCQKYCYYTSNWLKKRVDKENTNKILLIKNSNIFKKIQIKIKISLQILVKKQKNLSQNF